jgi:uncharacterized membrane protein (DUF373 family)
VAEPAKDTTHPLRVFVVRTLSLVEDTVYVGLGILLTVTALSLMSVAFKNLFAAIISRGLSGQVVNILDQILLILLIIELLYTVQVSFREHGLLAEPFLVVALIATIRRVLILTAEVSKVQDQAAFLHTMLELGLLTVMILVLVGSLIMMQKQSRRHREAPD